MANTERQETTRIRNWCLHVVCSPWQNFVSKVVVILNCIIFSIYDTYEFEVFFFVFFLLEMLMKMMALGIYGTDRSYLRSNWHKFEVFINFGQMFYCILASFGIHLKILRMLFLMRLISRGADLRDMVTGFLEILPVFCLFLTFIQCVYITLREFQLIDSSYLPLVQRLFVVLAEFLFMYLVVLQSCKRWRTVLRREKRFAQQTSGERVQPSPNQT